MVNDWRNEGIDAGDMPLVHGFRIEKNRNIKKMHKKDKPIFYEGDNFSTTIEGKTIEGLVEGIDVKTSEIQINGVNYQTKYLGVTIHRNHRNKPYIEILK
jgi:hypothetical protein